MYNTAGSLSSEEELLKIKILNMSDHCIIELLSLGYEINFSSNLGPKES